MMNEEFRRPLVEIEYKGYGARTTSKKSSGGDAQRAFVLLRLLVVRETGGGLEE